MIELRVLGTLDLRDDSHGGQIGSVLAQPKRTALLCYLAMATARGPHRRDSLLTLFWPESSEERARNSLNQAVFQLRRSLGEEAIVGTAEDLTLRPDALWCDAVALEQALAA
jgi:DNA-binding SARP family transcriptional activator